jgi:hypothetical protein
MPGHDVKPAESFVNAPERGPGHRLLLGVVIFLGALLVIGLGALVVGVAKKMGGPSSTAAPEAGLALPSDARIEAMEVSGNRLILRVAAGTGEEIDIVDTGDGHVVSRIKSAPPEVPH